MNGILDSPRWFDSALSTTFERGVVQILGSVGVWFVSGCFIWVFVVFGVGRLLIGCRCLLL